MRIALGQFNPIVGDLAGNTDKVRSIYKDALKAGADLLLLPELAICGYPPEDLLLKKHFLEDNKRTVEAVAADCADLIIVLGFAERCKDAIYNSAAVIQKGRITKIYRKALLPNYGVFDERRYFHPGTEPTLLAIDGLTTAVSICRDIWQIPWLTKFLSGPDKIDVILNLSASPFHLGKIETRKQIITRCAVQLNAAVCYCNLVGGQDELVFDGRSIIATPSGDIAATAKAFDEDLLIADINRAADGSLAITPAGPAAPQPSDLLDELYHALVLGTGDYVRKNGFEKVLIGLSGGIDSSLVTAIAAAALGPQNVIGVTMPSKFNRPETISDAEKLAKNLSIEFHTIGIAPVLEQFNTSLHKIPKWDDKGIAYENLQARIRGILLMSLSNQLGALVLTTGNKSETAVGYATLYGDTAGGFAVIKDVFKTMVYKLAEYINQINSREIIPPDVITRAPSAELKPDQKDTDSLPEYDLLDKILAGYVEQDLSAKQLIDSGLPEDTVRKVIRMVDKNEYKRRQCPPGVKITPKAFGRDRRLPITNRYNPFGSET